MSASVSLQYARPCDSCASPCSHFPGLTDYRCHDEGPVEPEVLSHTCRQVCAQHASSMTFCAALLAPLVCPAELEVAPSSFRVPPSVEKRACCLVVSPARTVRAGSHPVRRRQASLPQGRASWQICR
eukprot:6175256-Pleurochrysis_carterae.AAC.1